MSTARLLLGMTFRGIGWTLPMGALLGAVYSVLIIGSLFFLGRANVRPDLQPPPPAAVILSMAIVLGIGGGLVGASIGLVFGPIGGLLCGLMTRLFLPPSTRPGNYTQTVAIVAAAYGAVSTAFGLWIISGFNIPPPTGQAGNVLLFYLLPSIVGAGAGWFISRQIADWYQDARGARAERSGGGQLATA